MLTHVFTFGDLKEGDLLETGKAAGDHGICDEISGGSGQKWKS